MRHAHEIITEEARGGDPVAVLLAVLAYRGQTIGEFAHEIGSAQASLSRALTGQRGWGPKLRRLVYESTSVDMRPDLPPL